MCVLHVVSINYLLTYLIVIALLLTQCQTRDQKHPTSTQVAGDWHELMAPVVWIVLETTVDDRYLVRYPGVSKLTIQHTAGC